MKTESEVRTFLVKSLQKEPEVIINDFYGRRLRPSEVLGFKELMESMSKPENWYINKVEDIEPEMISEFKEEYDFVDAWYVGVEDMGGQIEYVVFESQDGKLYRGCSTGD